MEENKKICIICNKEFSEYGNNALPIKDGVCCDFCNYDVVVPARIEELEQQKD